MHQDDVSDYVLSSFKKEEKNLIEDKMGEIEELVQKFLQN
jgi:peptidyl-tRNA hydrolase